jgi:hypothetical protein
MWLTLTIDRLATKLSSAEFASVTAAQLPDGSFAEDVLAEEIERTVAMVRGYVSGNRENTLGEGETIPSELEDAALAILRHKIFTRIPGLKRLLDEGRVREYEDALQQLSHTASGRFRITPPTTAAVEQPAGPTITVVTRPIRINTREKWSGTL